MELFYVDKDIAESFTLSEEESKHIIRVLRFKKGDVVFLTNGKGDFFKAEIRNDNPKSCEVEIIEVTHQHGKRNYHLHLAIAPTKNIERFETFLEKATEIGIDEITPLICDHSERREIKAERLNKVLVAAMKQSMKAYLPKLNEARPFRTFIPGSSAAEKFICSMEAGKNNLLKTVYTKGRDALILVGPEGDFSKEEISLAQENNFSIVSLSESRLRTETAGIVACTTISLMNQ